jgi:DNA-binding CsgD family transcriptional regulator
VERYVLNTIQHIQDLLAESFGVSMVLVDDQGKELTIPSRLPESCLNSTAGECRRKILDTIREARETEQAAINQCHQRLYTFTWRTGFIFNACSTFLICGRISDLYKIEICINVITAIYSLPLNIANRTPKKNSGDRISHYTDSEILHTLTPQELKILSCIGKGYSNKEIASELFISANTVKSHLSRLLKKLGLTSRTGAAIFALEHSLTEKSKAAHA